MDLPVLLSEIMDGAGDVYLEPGVRLGVIVAHLFLFGLEVGVVGGGFCFGIREFLLSYVGF